MRAGELDQRITIQTKTVVNDHGDLIATWADTVTVWAGVTTTGGGEFYAAQKVNAETEVLFKIRNRELSTLQRIKYGSRIFEILAINQVNADRREIQISAKEVV